MLLTAQPNVTPAYRDPVRTTPIATRVERLIMASTFLPDEKLCSRIKAAAEYWVGYLLKAQIKSGSYAGGVPGATEDAVPTERHVRIDYVQHALSAWLVYKQVVDTASSK